MRRNRHQLLRRMQRTAIAAAVVIFAGITGLLAVMAGYEAHNQRLVTASQKPLQEMSRARHQAAVLGVSSMQQHMQATAPHIYRPLRQPAPATPAPMATVVHRVPTAEPVVFITIDDGVTPDAAGLDLIKQKRAVATLFLNQVNVHKHKDYYLQWQDSGSSVQNHTLSHPHLPKLRADEQQHQICSNASWLKGEYGKKSNLFRPPYGEYNDTTRQVAASCGQPYIVHWSAVVEKGHITYARGGMQPGEILLLHFTPDLARDLQAVFTDAEAKGLRIGRLEDWLR
jgi:peptidoglycan/xylan/chitin deacetylase (PgdA/CDA1 family)